LRISRRSVLVGLGAAGAAMAATRLLPARPAAAQGGGALTRPIPSSGERLPVIGMGSWMTFDVGGDRAAQDVRVEVLRAFFDRGGAVIDSSPMYASSERVIGYCLARIDDKQAMFSATKVWTPSKWMGALQMRDSKRLWGTQRFDLMQIHNLLNWQGHIETLAEWKASGRVHYLGITTSHGRRHQDFQSLMRSLPIDAVQFTYNILDRQAEAVLLPLAAQSGQAVIVNRPFRGGALIDRCQRHPLPAWAREIDCDNWAQFLLKFIVSHPAVTCAIPATSRVDHMVENMGAGTGRLPDARMRQRMIRHVEEL
jgi:diketogulonate reductase-like aldo/keto reductase